MVQMAKRERVPLVWMVDGAGARGHAPATPAKGSATEFIVMRKEEGDGGGWRPPAIKAAT